MVAKLLIVVAIIILFVKIKSACISKNKCCTLMVFTKSEQRDTNLDVCLGINFGQPLFASRTRRQVSTDPTTS